MENHPSSSINSDLFNKATAQFLTEIAEGNYIVAPSPPLIVSPLGIIPKPDGGIRIIHDCSRPKGQAVNDYVSDSQKFKYQSLDDATRLVSQGCFMAKVDLKSAYRSVPISKESQKVTGFKWHLNGRATYLYDCKLPFGSKEAPGIFHHLSQAVRRMMARKGFIIVAYLDDFFICEQSKAKCFEAFSTLLQLLRKLGFYINWQKVIDPTQSITFLDIEINSVTMHISLPSNKLSELKAEIADFMLRQRASKRQLQSLAGNLKWAASVVYGGRVFLRCIINAFCALKHKSHKMRLSWDIKQDIAWWHRFLDTFNGKSLLLHLTPITSLSTDACTIGAGGTWNDDWFYCNWEMDLPSAASLHINEKELLAVIIAAHRWAPYWANHTVKFLSDNSVTVYSINKCTSRNPFLMKCLRSLFWLSATYNFCFLARHVPGKSNAQADFLSRLHEDTKFSQQIWPYIPKSCSPHRDWFSHISHKTLCFLFNRCKCPSVGRQNSNL
jgi:hypothetical protein